jgi:4a-hydroxytetrahydrobiopterin dehydratase
MAGLAKRSCVACEGGLPRLNRREVAAHRRELDPGWKVVRGTRLRREFAFPDFASALRWTDAIGALAEAEWHHPAITLGWGRVAVEIWTHAAGALTLNDFVLAAKIDRLAHERLPRRARRSA